MENRPLKSETCAPVHCAISLIHCYHFQKSYLWICVFIFIYNSSWIFQIHLSMYCLSLTFLTFFFNFIFHTSPISILISSLNGSSFPGPLVEVTFICLWSWTTCQVLIAFFCVSKSLSFLQSAHCPEKLDLLHLQPQRHSLPCSLSFSSETLQPSLSVSFSY